MALPKSTLLALCAFGALACANSWAALGQSVDSIERDAHSMRALSLKSATPPLASVSYVRHEMSTPEGGLVWQFADSSGIVFAVSWATPVLPDFSVLLGSHKFALEHAQRKALAERQGSIEGRPSTLSLRVFSASEGDWTVHSGGQLQAYRGHSYLRSALPKDFDLRELSK